MKHLFAISLVFFSLTHLAKAERMDGLKMLNERYCSEQKFGASTAENEFNAERNPHFLCYNKLSLIGTQPRLQVDKYVNKNQLIADLTIRKKPKNNSP
jgi:hypothetical protein